MGDCVGPECRGCSAGDQIGSGQLHDTPDGAFSDAVQLMNVGRTGCGMHAFVCEKFGKLTGQEFPSVVAEGREASEEKPNVFRGFVLVTQHVDGFESGVIVNDDKRVTLTSIDGWKEGPGDVDVDEPRVEFASAHAAQEGGEACRRLRGASVVMSASCLSLAPPQCRRRCMKWAASLAAMT
eukprot:2004856-Pleurochrysis_carterae.AAC.3